MALPAADNEKLVLTFTKEAIFDQVKADNPAKVGTKTFEDVETIETDNDDTSLVAITFKKVIT